MGKFKLFCSMFVMVFAFCIMAAAAGSTSASAAKKVNVKSVKVAKPYSKKVSIVKGKSVKLSVAVKVTPNKKANKKVKYKSKNKKIATVSSKGVIKAKAAGKTKITITSKKNSKKKVVIKVTVRKKAAKKKAEKKEDEVQENNILSCETLDEETLKVTFKKAAVHKMSDFLVQSKKTANDAYAGQYTNAGLNTDDNITYYLSIDLFKESFQAGDFLKVSVPTAAGTDFLECRVKIKERECEPGDGLIGGKAGSDIGNILVNFGQSVIGTTTYSVIGLPAGLTYRTEGNKLYISGTPTAVSDNVIAVASAVDETGQTVTKNVRFVIGSDTQLVAYFAPVNVLANKRKKSTYTGYVAGGSGEYDIDAVKGAGLMNMDKVFCSCDGRLFEFECTENNAMPAGKYAVTCNITDEANAAITLSKNVEVNVSEGVLITGRLVDAAGEPMVGESVFARCSSSYGMPGYYGVSDIAVSDNLTDSNGGFAIRVFEGQSYNVYSLKAKAFNKPVNTGAVVNLKSICYKVKIPSPIVNSSIFSHEVNFAANFQKPGAFYKTYTLIGTDNRVFEVYDGVTYALPGTYSLHNQKALYIFESKDKISEKYDMTLDFTVTDANITVSPKMVGRLYSNMTLGTPVNVPVAANKELYVDFEAPEDGWYKVTSDNVGGSIGIVGTLDTDEEYVAVSGKIEQSVYLTKGQKYHFNIMNTGSADTVVNNLCVNKSASSDEYVITRGTKLNVYIPANTTIKLKYVAPETGVYDFAAPFADCEVHFGMFTREAGEPLYTAVSIDKGETYYFEITNLSNEDTTLKGVWISDVLN